MLLNQYPRIAGLLVGACVLGAAPKVYSQADANRGLWVGQATLNFVNEVTVPLDEDNIPRPSDPSVPTPTKDQAQLRLILHVNGAGQVSLLKDVAILDRGAGGVVGDGTALVNLIENPSAIDFTNTDIKFESDVTLITDERLYGDFPPQPAVRIASAVFDFGDSKATEAVDAVLEAVVNEVARIVQTKSRTDVDTTLERRTVEAAAIGAAETVAAPILSGADATESFDAFMRNELTSSDVDAIAAATTPATATQTTDAQAAASALSNASFFSDSRASDMVAAVLAAIAATPAPNKESAAHNAAAAFADVPDNYHRFLASKLLGDAIRPAAEAAVTEHLARDLNATASELRLKINANPAVAAAKLEAVRIQGLTIYKDTRASNAVTAILESIISNVLSSAGSDQDAMNANGEDAGRQALINGVARFAVPTIVPSLDYDAFINSDDFQESALLAAKAAAEAAVLDRNSNLFSNLTTLKNEGKTAALIALRNTYVAAARAVTSKLRLTGSFGPGQTGLTGTVTLPANHPTNPFRHRRHPDHTTGFNITRIITLGFDGGTTDPLERTGYNVDQITGTFEEEIHGLHKPLGTNSDIGLKVRGTFVLSRISLIDNLNAR